MVIVLCLLGVVGFLWYSQSSDLTTMGTAVEEEAQLVEFEKINNIKLDAEFFTDPFFVALQEFPVATNTVHDLPGRPNPFVAF